MVPAEDVSPTLAEAAAGSALHIVNELSNRRRLTTFFANEQSPFYGVQINYVNTGRGNLTFLNRDLVRLDSVPIVAGRVYDSQLAAETDFGPGWKLSVSEVIRQHGNALQYIDASGSVYELQLEGTRIVSSYPHLTGITGGRRQSGDIELSTARFTKTFRNIRGDYYLARIADGFGNSLDLHYTETQVSRISSQHGRYIEVTRDASGRISSMHDDAGRAVVYQYDLAGRLYSVRGVGGTQWRYRYDATGRLVGVTDPRGIDALTAGYSAEGRVGDARVLYDVMSFSYQGSVTAVRNGVQNAATFWHHASGLTSAIQDFAGATTEITFDEALRPASLSFNGAAVAQLRYGENGNLQEVRSSIEGRPRVTRFSYDSEQRLAAVVADDQPIAEYAYDTAGRVIRAQDAAGVRSYGFTGETGQQVHFGETTLDIQRNSFGLMSGFSTGHQSVAISYTASDQVSALQYAEYGDVYEVNYTYGASGLRSGGSYVVAEDEPAPANLSLDYDPVGNLTDLDLEYPDGAHNSQTYVLGINNQLVRLMNPRRADAAFEYDSAGRPTRRTLGTNYVSYTYDSLGRVAAVYERGRKMLEWRYGPMDVDAATEADDHTPWTAIDEPIASGIFGSVDSIAYARTRGTPFGPIRFNAAMARFVLPTQLVPSADRVTLVSLQRRNTPLSAEHHAKVSPGPLGFDRPSNALFLPPEFSSLNCYMCVAWISGAQQPVMYINGVPPSVGIPSVPLGTQETITVDGSGHCYGDIHYWDGESGQWQIDTVDGMWTHYFEYGDGGSSTHGVSNGASPDIARYYVHAYSDLFEVRDDIVCSCADGTMFAYDSFPTVAQNVYVYPSPPPPPNVVIRLTFDDGPAVGGNNNTQKVYAALQSNPVQNNIPATFFVQTHVVSPERGGTAAGAALMSEALQRGHNVMIHNGWTEDHPYHTERVMALPWGGSGANGLESDMIQAKSRIAGLPGPTPPYVRPPYGAWNNAVLQAYQATQLEMKLWDAKSFDDESDATFESISTHLEAELRARINGGDRDIIVLFHDVHSRTADNLGTPNGYIQQIRDVAASLGYTVSFAKL